jgi:hypothetical protein
VHTCTVDDPSARNSAASRHVAIPPIPEMGRRGTSRAIAATMCSAIGLTAGPQ